MLVMESALIDGGYSSIDARPIDRSNADTSTVPNGPRSWGHRPPRVLGAREELETMADRKKRLVYGFLEFLDQSVKDGTVAADGKESVEVAIQCLVDSFGLEYPGDEATQQRMSLKPATLLSIFDTFAAVQERRSQPGNATAPTAGGAAASAAGVAAAGATASAASGFRNLIASLTKPYMSLRFFACSL